MAPRSAAPGPHARPAPHAPSRREVQRLFFALWPGAAVRSAIAAATRRLEAAHRIGGRPLAPARYHLTLQFLGDFDPRAQSVIDAAIIAADEVRMRRFELRIDRSGSFGGRRVGWLGPARVPPGLQGLSTALGQALDRHGVPREGDGAGPWIPHVTVLRGMRGALPALEIAPLEWAVDGFVLIRSQPGHAGYDVLQHWALAEE